MAELNEQKILSLIKREIAADKKAAQYGVSRVPVHTHNGLDSPKVDFTGGLASRQIILPIHIPGTQAATSTNYGYSYMNPLNADSSQGIANQLSNGMTIITMTEVHQQAGTVAGAKVGIFVLRYRGGSTILVQEFSLTATANVLRLSTLKLGGSPAVVYPGDIIALATSGTLTNVADVLVTILLQY